MQTLAKPRTGTRNVFGAGMVGMGTCVTEGDSLLRSLGLIPLEYWQEKYLQGQLDAPVRKG